MQFSQQDIEKIKEKSCVAFLASRGYKPKSTRGRTYKYIRPWGGESIPSVHVYLESNTFVDFGNKEISGSVIQLCMATESVDFYKACEILMGNELPSKKIEEFAVRESPIKIKMVKQIESAWIRQYLAKRCIPLSIAQQFCKQVHCEVTANDKVYKKTCVGFANDKGAWELRNPKTKISTSPKWWTTINPNQKEVYVYEGFCDMLSFVALFGYKQNVTHLVLNGIGHIHHVDFSGYECVRYMSDNDLAGDQGFEKIIHQNKKDERGWFAPKKDINEYLMSKTKTEGTLYRSTLSSMLSI